MIQASVHGRIGSDPASSTTSKGSEMTRVSLAVDATGHNADTEETLWVSVLAFGRVAETLARMRAAYPDALSFEPLFGLTPAMEQPRDAA